jgi:hypothetical protein
MTTDTITVSGLVDLQREAALHARQRVCTMKTGCVLAASDVTMALHDLLEAVRKYTEEAEARGEPMENRLAMMRAVDLTSSYASAVLIGDAS